MVDATAVRGAHATIKDALAAAVPGTLIVVKPGTYREALVIEKAVEIVGEGRLGQVVIEASERAAIVLDTDRAALRNLVIRATGTQSTTSAAVWVKRGRPVIEGCTLTSAIGPGMYVGGSSSDPTVRECTFADGKQSGIWVVENGAGTFERCTVTGNAKAGIRVETGGNPTVRECTVERNRDHGIKVWDTGLGTITGCRLSGNKIGRAHV